MSETSPAAFTRANLQRTTVRDVAERAIREMILAGELAPSSRLNEVAIAEELGISRGPLREAIQRLASEGLLQIVPHKGAFVVTLDETELRELYQLRVAIETFCARTVASTASRAERETFRETLREAEAALSESGQYPPDMDFHRALVALAGNGLLVQTAHDVNSRISIARNRSAREPIRAQQAFQEHMAIADAILAGRAAQAARLIESHLRRSFENAAKLLMTDAAREVRLTDVTGG